MEQLFKAKTVQQFKIMEWLLANGITKDDIAQVDFIGEENLKITNPAGGYMFLSCDDSGKVSVDQAPPVPEERRDELYSLWCEETNDAWTEEWRENLTPEEISLVDAWDEKSNSGLLKVCQDILAHKKYGQAEDLSAEEDELEM